MIVKIKKINPNAQTPTYGTIASAGCDLYAAIDEPTIIKPLERSFIPTGIAIEIPSGYYGMVASRSGMSLKNGIIILNSPGIVDSDYRGELKCILINLSNQNFIVKNGMRIAQLILHKYEKIDWIEKTELRTTLRGENGFGSTGQ